MCISFLFDLTFVNSKCLGVGMEDIWLLTQPSFLIKIHQLKSFLILKNLLSVCYILIRLLIWMRIYQILNALLVFSIKLIRWLRKLWYWMSIITIKDAKWLLCDRVSMIWRWTIRRSIWPILLAAQHLLLPSWLVSWSHFGLVLLNLVQIWNETLLLLDFG